MAPDGESHAATAARDRPTITVVIAVFNGAKSIQVALDSVFEQTHRGIELVVMDGASTDGTVDILRRNAERIAYWESEPDRGIFHAWNKALDHATGEWICFLGADDRYHDPEALAQVADALARDEGAHRVAYGGLDKLFPDGTVYQARGTEWTARRRRRFRRGEMIPHPATFHHRSLFERNGRFDESFTIAGDYEFLLRELLEHEPLYVPVVVVDMSAGGLSDKPSNRYTVAREVHRARYMHGVTRADGWRSPTLWRRLARVWVTNTFGRGRAASVANRYRRVRRR